MTIAALPMYDWPEARAETDAEWRSLRARLSAAGIDAPEEIVRRNAELPAVPGGIHDDDGRMIAPDPATLPSDELDFPTLWKHPALLFAQTCWGPM
jgi:ABC-type phosphate/phosphonate transport system substrate-binding protein